MIRHPTPPPPPPSQTSSPPSAQNCRKRNPHNNRMTRCPRHLSHQPHRKAPAPSPSPTPSPQWSAPAAPHHPGPQQVSGPATGVGGPRRHTPMGRNHTWAPGHPPPLDHRTHHYLDTTNGPPPPPPHHPRGCHHHTDRGRPHNSRAHTPASIVGTYDGTSLPHPTASHRHHLPHPQRPHTHLAATVGGHPGGPPPRTPRAHAHPPHPPPGTRSRPSTTRHTQPGVIGVHHTHKPTTSGGRQDRTIHPASLDPDPAPQHPTRLHHLVGISRPRHPHPPARGSPSGNQHNRPSPGLSSGSHPGRGPEKPGAGAPNTWSKPKWRPTRKPKKSPHR